MNNGSVIFRAWLKCGGAILIVGILLGCGHNPNKDIDMEQAQSAANRVHTPPKPGDHTEPGHGG